MSERFDILVVGAGPAGIAAAVSAAAAGKRVGLVDDNPAPGGQIWRSGSASARGCARLARKTRCRSRSAPSGMARLRLPRRGVLRAECNGDCCELRYGQTDSGDRRAGALSAVSRMDTAQRDGRGRPGRDGARRTADCRKARSGGRNRSAAAGGGGASGASWREDRRPVRAGSVAPVRSAWRCIC